MEPMGKARRLSIALLLLVLAATSLGVGPLAAPVAAPLVTPPVKAQITKNAQATEPAEASEPTDDRITGKTEGEPWRRNYPRDRAGRKTVDEQQVYSRRGRTDEELAQDKKNSAPDPSATTRQ
jgi:hypothetical protein